VDHRVVVGVEVVLAVDERAVRRSKTFLKMMCRFSSNCSGLDRFGSNCLSSSNEW
jgi:hypothetical protein